MKFNIFDKFYTNWILSFYFAMADESEIRPYEDDEQEDDNDNDTNITDDEENVDVVSEVNSVKS